MHAFRLSLAQYGTYIRRHPLLFALLAAIFLAIALSSHLSRSNTADAALPHALGYLGAVCLCGLLTDIIVNARPAKVDVSFPIKRWPGLELAIIFGSILLGLIFILLRFHWMDWEQAPGITRLLLLPLLLFVYSIALGLLFFFGFRYRLPELGFRGQYWYVALPVIAIFGAVTLWLAPHSSHWQDAWAEMGLLDIVLTGLLGAGLSEEFTRMLLQTRIGRLLRNMGAGLLLATLVWAALHIPVFSKGEVWSEAWQPACLGAMRIAPLGLLWGYITYRTGSIVPATLIHGLNLWGLQNL